MRNPFPGPFRARSQIAKLDLHMIAADRGCWSYFERSPHKNGVAPHAPFRPNGHPSSHNYRLSGHAAIDDRRAANHRECSRYTAINLRISSDDDDITCDFIGLENKIGKKY